MSRLFGDIRQFAFIVNDIDAAMAYWSQTLGVGPFFIRRDFTFEEFMYRGKACPSPHISYAAANSGAIQIELIQQLDETPSMYRDFITKNGNGLQHVSSWLTRDEYDRHYTNLIKKGFNVLQQGSLRKDGPRVAYFATDTFPGGIVFEIADLTETGIYDALQNIANAAQNWDGKDPVRED